MTARELREFLDTLPEHALDFPVALHHHCSHPHADMAHHEVVFPAEDFFVSRAWGVTDNTHPETN